MKSRLRSLLFVFGVGSVLLMSSYTKREFKLENVGYGGYNYEKADGNVYVVFYDNKGERHLLNMGDREFEYAMNYSQEQYRRGRRIQGIYDVFVKERFLFGPVATKIERKNLPELEKRELEEKISEEIRKNPTTFHYYKPN